MRIADIMVESLAENCEDISNRIVDEYCKNITEISYRIGNSKVNLVASVIYRDSEKLFEMIEYIKKMKCVESVDWTEIEKKDVKNNGETMHTFFYSLSKQQN